MLEHDGWSLTRQTYNRIHVLDWSPKAVWSRLLLQRWREEISRLFLLWWDGRVISQLCMITCSTCCWSIPWQASSIAHRRFPHLELDQTSLVVLPLPDSSMIPQGGCWRNESSPVKSSPSKHTSYLLQIGLAACSRRQSRILGLFDNRIDVQRSTRLEVCWLECRWDGRLQAIALHVQR